MLVHNPAAQHCQHADRYNRAQRHAWVPAWSDLVPVAGLKAVLSGNTGYGQ